MKSVKRAFNFTGVAISIFAFLLLHPHIQLAAQPNQKPDLSELSQWERQSIESACAYENTIDGPAAYYRCLANKVAEVSATGTSSTGVPQSRSISQFSSGMSEQSKLNSSTGSTVGGTRSPGRTPEQEKLSFFVGQWTIEGEIKTSPLGPSGGYTGTHRNDWAPDGVSLILHWDEHRPTGSDSGTGVYTYDAVNRNYKYQGTSSDGETENSVGTLQGDTWTWLSNISLPSAEIARGRFVIRQTSTAAYDFRFEIGSQAGVWTLVMEGKATKGN
jgi:hypothetical protein